LPMAMQGLVVVPLFAAYDLDEGAGRIFGYDVGGGPYEHRGFHAIGSGSLLARGALKKLYREDASPPDTVVACLQAPHWLAEDGAELVHRMLDGRMTAPDGPTAPLY